MGPDGLLEEELLKGRLRAALATDMRVTFAGLPSRRCGAPAPRRTRTHKAKFGKEPTSYALYAAEGTASSSTPSSGRRPAIEKAKDVATTRGLRKAIAATKNFDGIQRQVELRRER